MISYVKGVLEYRDEANPFVLAKILSVSRQQSTFCKSLWIRASAKCCKCRCKWTFKESFPW